MPRTAPEIIVTRSTVPEQRQVAPDGSNLVFVVGVPRSGTTLLCALLDNHPEIVCPPEPWIMLALESLGQADFRHPADANLLSTGVAEFLAGGGGIGAARAAARAAYEPRLVEGRGRILVDKTPRYFHILPFIDAVFPAARYVLMQRSPIDVAASYKATWEVDVAHLLREDPGHPVCLDLVLGWRRIGAFAVQHDRRVLAASYERLVREPQAELSRIIDFVGADGGHDLLHLRRTLEPLRVATMGDKRILQTDAVHRDSIGRGLRDLETDELQSIHDALGAPLLRELAGDPVVDDLRRRGVVDRGPEVTARQVEQAESALARRWSEARTGALVPPPGQGAAELEAQIASMQHLLETEQEAHRRRLEASQERFAALRDDHRTLQREIQELHRSAEGAMAFRREYEGLSPVQRIRHALRQIAIESIRWIASRESARPLPSISIITPVIDPDADSPLQCTLASVAGQGYPKLEHIVVTTGADEPDLQALQAHQGRPPRLVDRPGGNRIDAINAGLAAATGDLLSWIDPGDVYEPGGLRRVGDLFRRRRRTQAAYFDGTIEIDGWRLAGPRLPVADLLESMAGRQGWPRGGVFIGRDPFRSITRLDPGEPEAAEELLWLALTRWFRMRRGRGHVCCRTTIAGERADRPGLPVHRRRAIARFRRTVRTLTWTRRVPRSLWRRLRNAAGPAMARGRLIFPLRETASLPAAALPDRPWREPACPMTGAPPDRLLLSVREAGFDPPRLRRIHAWSKGGLAVSWPPVSGRETRRFEASTCAAPPGRCVGPFQWFEGRRGLAARLTDLLPEEIVAGLAAEEPRQRGPRAADELLSCLGGHDRTRDAGRRMLELGCGAGLTLQALERRTTWDLHGIEVNPGAAEQARAAGHRVWTGPPAEAPYLLPDHLTFDVIYASRAAELTGDLARLLQRVAPLLEPGGRLVLALPNLRSGQLERFGPTWSPWSTPIREAFCTPRALRRTAAGCGLVVRRVSTSSDVLTTARSMHLNSTGLGAELPESWRPDPEALRRARRMVAWSRLWLDRRGRGDHIIATLQRPAVGARGSSQ